MTRFDLLRRPAYTLFTLLHVTEAETASDYIRLISEGQDGRSLQIVEQKEVSDCMSSLDWTQFQMPRRSSYEAFLYEREAGTACD